MNADDVHRHLVADHTPASAGESEETMSLLATLSDQVARLPKIDETAKAIGAYAGLKSGAQKVFLIGFWSGAISTAVVFTALLLLGAGQFNRDERPKFLKTLSAHGPIPRLMGSFNPIVFAARTGGRHQHT
jgi:hypothetical protein